MLFNSYEFILVFLPVTLIGFFACGRFGWRRGAKAWLTVASLCFYGWWDPRYVVLLVGSILFNFSVGRRLCRPAARGADRGFLVLGVGVNLALLAYYKYANFFLDNLNATVGTHWQLAAVVLPLGISFFTFTQIAYLVDAYRQEVHEYRLLDYSLFVTFFPHLIAGPVLHHREIMPQFAADATLRPSASNFSVGLTIFAVGLFKKVVLADGVAQFATPVFAAANAGEPLTLLSAWGGALAYTLQLYFDFSGYSDMAIGLARLFGIRFPLNFNSPYRAASIIEFWRCWHMTLSRFLRDYVYISLGGNRQGRARRYVNLLVTMLLGGLWHGAAWNFVLWGALHGVYVVINHAWRAVQRALPAWLRPLAGWGTSAGYALTFLAVVAGWVLFRADDLDSAWRIYQAMAGVHGITRADPYYFGAREVRWLAALLAISWFAPNVQQMLSKSTPALETYPGEIRPLGIRWLQWRPAIGWALVCGTLSLFSITRLSHVSEFLYFQF